MKKKHEKTNFKGAVSYSEKAPEELRPVCEILRKVITGIMPKNSGRIYNKFPVWFIDDAPAAVYFISKEYVTLFFWNGGEFKTPGLICHGTSKAAQTTYGSVADIDNKALRKWTEEAKEAVYDREDTGGSRGGLTPF